VPDVYASITTADAATLERLVGVLELRAADTRQKEMRDDYLGAVALRDGTRLVEIGCGTGAVSRALAARPEVTEVIGVDPSPVFLERARDLAAPVPGLSFIEADGREIPLPDASFDAAVFHTTLCHIPQPELALAEAHRLLRPGGVAFIFDGDYATTTVAVNAIDPLQVCADAAIAAIVHDPWLVRRLPGLVKQAGFVDLRARSHGYVGIDDADYMLTIVDRGADAMVASGRIGETLADALKKEARRRSERDEFFGHIAYFSLVARKPAS
jgi:ubiquinone/menaquinone biosynthesis C-methylase UbiE